MIIEKSKNFFPFELYNPNKIILIGDIHGCLNKLLELLKKLNYYKKNGIYYHPDYFTIFVGDIIDRGEYMKEALDLIFSMIEKRYAISIMGNHEFNFINTFTKSDKGEPLRPLEKLPEKTNKIFSEYEKKFWSQKFLELPLLLDFGNIRIIHATWDKNYVDYFAQKSADLKISYELLLEYFYKKDLKFYKSIRFALKGKEIENENLKKIFSEKYHKFQNSIRIKWWEKIENPTWKKITVKSEIIDESKQHLLPIPKEFDELYNPYPEQDPPIFFGHYSMSGEPKILKENVACIDYGAVYGNYLTAYVWDGEIKLDNNKLIFVK